MASRILSRSDPPGAPAGTIDAGAYVPRRYTSVVAILAIGLSALSALDGPRAWGPFAKLLLPVLVLSLAMTFAASLAVTERASIRLVGYPLFCGLGGLAGGVLGLVASASLRVRTIDTMVARPITWHLAASSLVAGVLVGITLWWLQHLRRHDHLRDCQLFDSQAALLRARAEAAEADAARARVALQLLQAQVEPHFLYNALANLRYLVKHDADLAQRLVDQLVRYFRAALPSLREIEVSLAQELELCEAFAAIQALRLGDALTMAVDVAPDLRAASLPPGVLLTLVENAFKHGAPPPNQPRQVTIVARRAGAELQLSVVDNGAPTSLRAGLGEPGSGMGLKWLAQRLHAAHGDRATLELTHLPGGGCRAAMILPFGPCEATR